MARLLTLDDFYALFSEHSRSTTFSAKNETDEIVVSLPARWTFESNTDDASEGLTKVHLQSCHTLDNTNHCFIAEDVMTAALPSFSNRPILAFIFKDDNGDYQFNTHRKHIDKNGETVYDEVPVGIIPESCNAHLQYDEEKGKTYVEVDGYIFDEYSKAKEILEREGECNVSVELAIREFSYDAKKRLLILSSIRFEGVTILGVREDGTKIIPGMEGSNITIVDFQKKNNAEFSQNEMMQMLKQIESKLNELTIYSKGKEEQNVEDQNQTVVTEPVPTEPETAPVEPENTVPAEPDNQPENAEPETAPVEPTAEPEGGAVEPDGTENNTEPEGGEPENSEPAPAQFSKTFELAHDDIRVAIYNLLSAFETANNEWYYIEKVYDSYVIYSGESGLYKQEYTKNNDTVEFVGERIHMNAEYVTDDELAILNEMRSNYASLIEKLAQYESEPDKIALLGSKDYALISKNAEFQKLQNREVYFSMTVDELKSKCEEILNSEAKKLGQTYAAKEDTTVKAGFSAKPIMPNKPFSGHGRYGAMFVK